MRKQAAQLPTWSYSLVFVGRKPSPDGSRPFVKVPVGIICYTHEDGTPVSRLYLSRRWISARARMSVEGCFKQFESQRKQAEKMVGHSRLGDKMRDDVEALSLFHVGNKIEVQVGPFSPATSPAQLIDKYIGSS